MATIDVFNVNNEKVGEHELDDAVFNVEVKDHLMHAAVRKQLNARRSGTHAVKRRADVRGGGKKPFRQKGTGRARQGTVRAAHYRGGGVVFGPEPRSYDFKINKKELRYALCSALSRRAQEGALLILDEMSIEAPKTKTMVGFMSRFELGDMLLVTESVDANVSLSSRNIPKLSYVPAKGVNVYDVLRRSKLVMTRSALEAVTARLGGN